MADVGTDHAYLPVHLVHAGHVPRAVASDRMPGPLQAARRAVAAAGLADRIDLRQGDGLAVLKPGEVMSVVLAGMGGSLMCAILGAGPSVLDRLHRLVLQPNAGEETVRRWLATRGWQLVDEALVADAGRVYVVMAAEPGPPGTPAEADFVLGPHLRRRRGDLFGSYVRGELVRAQRALQGAQQARSPDPDRLEALIRRVQLLEEALAP